MNYIKLRDKLQIIGKQDFNPQHILECGQIFCFQKDGEKFKVWSADKFAVVEETPNGFDILTKDVDYFENFFDLKTDYSAIKAELAKHEIMREPIKFGQGIRILKNDAFEVLISFIISANNNIKRIQKTIFAMKARFCSEAFPTQDQLLSLNESDFYQLGLGYRAPQMYKALRQFTAEDLQLWKKLSTEKLRAKLISISGVGPKVADCVLLFGFGRKDVFPVDTWINKMYNMFYQEENNRESIRKKLLEIFGAYAGYAQQYLFYFQRSFLKM